MAWSPPVPFQPGINTERTPILNASGWSSSNLIRFRDGLPEKNGGWSAISQTPFIGSVRGVHAWSDLNSNPYFAGGSEQRLEVFSLGGVTDITPLAATDDVTIDFSTVSTSETVTIRDATYQPSVGDWVNINIPISVGGLVLQGFYEVQTVGVPTGTDYTITAAAPATGTVNHGGAVPTYTTTNLSTNTKVTLANHGLTTDNFWINQVALTVGGVALGAYQQFEISNVIDASNFQITTTAATGNAGPTAENSGDAQLLYLVPTGYASAELVAGFGEGLFGAGYYGISGSNNPTYSTIRQWFLDNWGEDLIGNYPGSPVFVWVPPIALGNVAIPIDGTNFMGAAEPPTKVNVSFVSMPQQILMALGCDPYGGDQDPNLVRWTDVADFTDWEASATNQAGSFRIPTGSRLVGGVVGSAFGLLWTDIDMWIFNYIGFPLVFGFTRIAGGAGLIAGRCISVTQTAIYFATNNGIYRYDGSGVSIVPCPVWDVIWRNLNRVQIDKCHMGSNSWFNEIMMFFPSNTGNGEVDSYIRLNYRDNVWDYGTPVVGGGLIRLSWYDTNVFGPPIGVDQNGYLQQHEVSYDADGQQMMEFIQSGYFAISNGLDFLTIQKMIADFKFEGVNATVQYWVYTIDFPTDTPVEYGPFVQTPTGPEQSIINGRGRMASIKIGFSSTGSFWRMGNMRYLYALSGHIGS